MYNLLKSLCSALALVIVVFVVAVDMLLSLMQMLAVAGCYCWIFDIRINILRTCRRYGFNQSLTPTADRNCTVGLHKPSA